MLNGKMSGCALLCVLTLAASAAHASPGRDYTATLQGPLGLNTVPSARMQESGTVSAGISLLDPYAHAWLGLQIAPPLHINLRQSAETSNIDGDPDRLYPGVDLKLRLAKESRLWPDISLGLQSAVGHKRMAGEYLALSKRHGDFDFTLGLGWGRFAGAAHIGNPLKIFGSHFGKDRGIDREMPNEPTNWFTGDEAGFFGGVEYFTPLQGLSLKFDIGGDRYEMEKAAFGFDAPAPWSLGAVFQPASWIDIALGTQGAEKLMARVSLHASPGNWPWKNKITEGENFVPMRPYRTGLALPAQMEQSAEREAMLLYDAQIDPHSAQAVLDLDPSLSAPAQYGRAAKHIANHAGPDIEAISLTPEIMNLRGPTVKLMRRDFEQAVIQQQGSPQEIWQGTKFTADEGGDLLGIGKPRRFLETILTLENEAGLSEEDNGVLYRTSLIAEARTTRTLGALTGGASLRLNIKDNLRHLDQIRLRPPLPVRSDVDDFTDDRLTLDRSYISWAHSITPEWHTMLTGGYLEEMYAGFGGEILYRPFGPRFALGADIWQVFKRDPKSDFAVELTGDHLATGHINAWYDIPGWDVTAQARVGRYLAEDIGSTFALMKDFQNGAKLEGFITITDNADFDLFGGTTHAHHGVRLTLPLGRLTSPVPVRAQARFSAAPFGRDTGQSIDKPLPLYEVTQPFSYAHIARHWNDILEKEE